MDSAFSDMEVAAYPAAAGEEIPKAEFLQMLALGYQIMPDEIDYPPELRPRAPEGQAAGPMFEMREAHRRPRVTEVGSPSDRIADVMERYRDGKHRLIMETWGALAERLTAREWAVMWENNYNRDSVAAAMREWRVSAVQRERRTTPSPREGAQARDTDNSQDSVAAALRKLRLEAAKATLPTREWRDSL